MLKSQKLESFQLQVAPACWGRRHGSHGSWGGSGWSSQSTGPWTPSASIPQPSRSTGNSPQSRSHRWTASRLHSHRPAISGPLQPRCSSTPAHAGQHGWMGSLGPANRPRCGPIAPLGQNHCGPIAPLGQNPSDPPLQGAMWHPWGAWQQATCLQATWQQASSCPGPSGIGTAGACRPCRRPCPLSILFWPFSILFWPFSILFWPFFLSSQLRPKLSLGQVHRGLDGPGFSVSIWIFSLFGSSTTMTSSVGVVGEGGGVGGCGLNFPVRMKFPMRESFLAQRNHDMNQNSQ